MHLKWNLKQLQLHLILHLETNQKKKNLKIKKPKKKKKTSFKEPGFPRITRERITLQFLF